MIVAVVVRRKPSPHPVLPPSVLDEFDMLLTRLDLHTITPAEWSRLKTLIVIATLEAGDAEAGRRAYASALAKWRVARRYTQD